MSEKLYAEAAWIPKDIMCRFDVSRERAEEWLSEHETFIRDRVVQHGWEVIETLGEGDLPTHRCDKCGEEFSLEDCMSYLHDMASERRLCSDCR